METHTVDLTAALGPLREALCALRHSSNDRRGALVADALLRRQGSRRSMDSSEIPATATRLELSTDEGCLAGWSWGAGPVVVLVHGLNGRADQLVHWVDDFVQAGFRVVSYDAPGHGASPGALATLQNLRHGLEICVAAVGRPHAIVAHSAGAAGLFLAMDRGLRADCYVLIAPPLHFGHWVDECCVALDLDAATATATRRHIERLTGQPLAEQRVDLNAAYLSGPLLVVHDAEDREVPVACGRTIAAAWHGALTVVTVGWGHRRILHNPDVGAQVLEFVTRSAASTGSTLPTGG